MKKLLSFTLTLLLILALAACGGGGSDGSSGSSGAGSGEVQAEDGFAEARIGDVVHSYFMDFTVNGAYTTAEYHGHTAPEGKQVLVVELTVKNTFNESLPMYDDDFQGQWSASAETEEYAWPITWSSTCPPMRRTFPSLIWSCSTTAPRETPSLSTSPPRRNKGISNKRGCRLKAAAPPVFSPPQKRTQAVPEVSRPLLHPRQRLAGRNSHAEILQRFRGFPGCHFCPGLL